MKKRIFTHISQLLIVIIMSIFFSSCGTTVWQLKTDCNISNEDLFKQISQVLISEGFIIKSFDDKLGYLQAETQSKFNAWTGLNEIRYWIFQSPNTSSYSSVTSATNKSNKIIAMAKVVYMQQNMFGATTGGSEKYYNDDVNKDWTWYWNVRNSLVQICGNKILFVKKTQN